MAMSSRCLLCSPYLCAWAPVSLTFKRLNTRAERSPSIVSYALAGALLSRAERREIVSTWLAHTRSLLSILRDGIRRVQRQEVWAVVCHRAAWRLAPPSVPRHEARTWVSALLELRRPRMMALTMCTSHVSCPSSSAMDLLSPAFRGGGH